MRKLLFLLQIFLLQSIALTAQVGIGTDTPDPSAVLDLKGNGKQGLLMPQVDDYHSIDNPKPGLIVYDKYKKAIVLYDGNNWIEVNSSRTVADIRNVYLQPRWKDDIFKSFSQLTMEALVRAESFDGISGIINGLMGNSNGLMIRIGDAKFPKDQIQVYKGNTRFPGSDTSKRLPLNEWVHIAVTYNGSNHTIIIYVNGNEQSKNTVNFGNTIDLKNGRGFFIGADSFYTNRNFVGEILECRVWNVVRTQEQIANHRYSIDPNAKGLVGYWKFDDGVGYIVKDYSAHHNDLEAKSNSSGGKIKWKHISPPYK